jgi:hypothetical protein
MCFRLSPTDHNHLHHVLRFDPGEAWLGAVAVVRTAPSALQDLGTPIDFNSQHCLLSGARLESKFYLWIISRSL